MNAEAVISVRNVSKKFHVKARPRLLRERIQGAFRSGPAPEFLAVDDISFEVARGESVALVGPNGAGKSTILSLVAGLAMPTSGSIRVKGRVGPLLQLGAGFHHDLTGLENIRLNASLMGLSRSETERLFAAIADFAEVGDFIREPIRAYSTGMMMRLAFSVAIHLNPEVLIVDEVLGVGDAHFQQKCFDRFIGFREAGHTILAVSHAPEMLLHLCSRALWIDRGRVRMDGPVAPVVEAYTASLLSPQVPPALPG